VCASKRRDREQRSLGAGKVADVKNRLCNRVKEGKLISRRLSCRGVRSVQEISSPSFILHHEVERIKYEYLKQKIEERRKKNKNKTSHKKRNPPPILAIKHRAFVTPILPFPSRSIPFTT